MKVETSRGRRSSGVGSGVAEAKPAQPEQPPEAASIFDELHRLEQAMRHQPPGASKLDALRSELAMVFDLRDRARDAAHQEALDKLDLARVRRADRRAGVRGWIGIAYRLVGLVGAGVVVADAAGLLHPSTGVGALIRWLIGSA